METYSYDFLNLYNAYREPSTVHCSDTYMVRYFTRYLFQKAISVFEWDGMPEHWSKDFFLYVLYARGYLAITDIPGYGPIPQNCSLRGLNIFYQPKEVIIANPAIKGQMITRTIDKDCVLLKLTPDYAGIIDIVSIYADKMALCLESAGINILNSKLAYVFASKNKNFAEAFKKMFDQINAGNPAVFIDKDLMNEDGSPSWMTFTQDIKSNFIAPELIEMLKQIENNFDAEIGLPNNPTEKKERLITDEVNANNASTFAKSQLWLDSLKEGIKKANSMFGLELSVEWREKMGGEAYAGMDQPDGSVQME